MLRRHKITVEVLQRPTSLEVEAYRLDDITYQREYNHAAAVRVVVGEVVTSTRTFPAGTFVVSTAQMNGRVVAHMLEPETNDNVVRWNTMDAWLPKTRMGDRGEQTAQGRGGGQRGRAQNAAGGQRGRRGGRRGRGQAQGPAVIPIYKVMAPTPLATKILH